MFDLYLTNKKSGEKFLLRWDGEMKVRVDTFRDLGAAFIAAFSSHILPIGLYTYKEVFKVIKVGG